MPIARLYAILDTDVLAARRLAPIEVCDAWLHAGVRLIQLRAKGMASGPMLALADALVTRTRTAGATFIINDRADIAAQCGADGVHVGQDDLSPADVRVVVGTSSMVGFSTHTDSQVALALAQPIAYLAVGPVFTTSTKDTGYSAVGLDQVRRAAAAARPVGVPVVAIGGITRANARAVRAAGADALAVITDLLDDDATPLGSRAREWVLMLDSPSNIPERDSS